MIITVATPDADQASDLSSAHAERANRLEDAQASAIALFDEVVSRVVIAAGQSEQAVSDRIRDLANEKFGKTRHWHKRIIRSGPHTMFPYRENPPDRIIEPDDIVFADLGPIFEEFEADLGRTCVLGDDLVKHRLAADLPVIFSAGQPSDRCQLFVAAAAQCPPVAAPGMQDDPAVAKSISRPRNCSIFVCRSMTSSAVHRLPPT